LNLAGMNSTERSLRVLRLNPRIQTFPFDGDNRQPMVLCEVARSDENVARYTLPRDLVDFIRAFDGVRDTDEVIREHCAARGDHRGIERYRQLVERILEPRELLVPAQHAAGEPARASSRSPVKRGGPAYLTLRVRILPWRLVRPVAESLSWMFLPPVVTVFAGLVVAAHIVFYAVLGSDRYPDAATLQGRDVIWLMAVLSLGALAHELGHATASVRYGCRKIEIGWGLYWYMAVLYTDLSEVWRLPRRQRAVVDVAGIYFQAVFMVALLVLLLATGSKIAAYGFLLTDVALAMSLHPFLRMDGFWLVTDLFGISNLREYTSRMLRNLLARFRGGQQSAPGVDLSTRAKIGLCLYMAGGIGFVCYVWIHLLTGVAFDLVQTYGASLQELTTDLFTRPLPISRLAGDMFDVLWRSLVLLGLCTFVYRCLRSAVRVALRLARALQGTAQGSAPQGHVPILKAHEQA
jgi:putative peptide zinc metalloprotease protein